jgi:hypothetical protein
MGVRYPRPLICHVNSEEKKRWSLRISRSDIVRVAVVSRHHAGHPISKPLYVKSLIVGRD